jgi:hypothetical protein
MAQRLITQDKYGSVLIQDKILRSKCEALSENGLRNLKNWIILRMKIKRKLKGERE